MTQLFSRWVKNIFRSSTPLVDFLQYDEQRLIHLHLNSCLGYGRINWAQYLYNFQLPYHVEKSPEMTRPSPCSYWLVLSNSTFNASTFFCKVEISSFKSEVKSYVSSLKSFIFKIISSFYFFTHSKSEVTISSISWILEIIFNT